MIKAIILDFDGVIAESVHVKTEAFAEMYCSYGEDIVKKVVAHHLRNGGVSRFEKFSTYHSIFLGVDLNEKQIKELSACFSDLVMEKVIKAPYVPGAIEFIKNNYIKYDLYISSGTPENEMKEVAKRRNISSYFRDIYGSPEKKTEHVRKIINKHKYSSSEVVFIGDAMSDVQAAKENSIRFIARVDGDESPLKDEKNNIPDLISIEEKLKVLL